MSIILKNISKSFGQVTVLNDIDLSVKTGEYHVVLGPSGTGKSLLLKLIAGFESAKDGIISVSGQSVHNLPPQKRNIGYVFQDFALFPHLTVFENIAYGLRASGVKRKFIKPQVDEIVETIGIGDLIEKYPEQISGGQKQRVALARALVLKPKVLLLDEPTSSLDSRLQEKIWQELKSLHRKTGITILHVTHNNAEAMFLADRVSILFNGRILQTEAPDQLFYHPKSPVVAQFVGASNIFNGHVRHLGERFADIRVVGKHPDNYLNLKMLAFPRFAKSNEVSFCVHPEKIVLQDRPSPENCFPGKITRYVSYGSFIELAIDVYGFQINAKVQESIFANLKLQKDVFVHFPPEAFHPFCGRKNRKPTELRKCKRLSLN